MATEEEVSASYQRARSLPLPSLVTTLIDPNSLDITY